MSGNGGNLVSGASRLRQASRRRLAKTVRGTMFQPCRFALFPEPPAKGGALKRATLSRGHERKVIAQWRCGNDGS